MQNLLINEFVKFVEKGDSFSRETLTKVAYENNIKYSILEVLFPQNINTIIEIYIKSKLENIIMQDISNIDGFTRKVQFSSSTLLQNFYENQIFTRQMIKYLFLHLHFGVKLLYNISSYILKICGDRSLNFSYYTKRITLFTIYTSIICDIMKNKDLHNIQIKLHNGIENTKLIPKIKAKIKKLLLEANFF